MNHGFCKVFSDMLTSSVWLSTDKETKLLWLTMLLMADKDGIVATGVMGLARMSMLTLPETEKALAVLLAPDPYSKTPDLEGRRLTTTDGGWKIVNYAKYRDKWVGMRRRVDTAERQRLYRLRKKAGVPAPKRGRPKKSVVKELEQMPEADWDAPDTGPPEDEDQF